MKLTKPKTRIGKTGSEPAFQEIVSLITTARQRAYQAVNTQLIDLYWQVGQYISHKLESAAWGEGVVEELARYLEKQHPDIKGFTRRSLFRMRQFFETYRHDSKVSPLVTQIHTAAETIFKDTYFFDFLELSDGHSESDLQQGLAKNLRRFLLELGRDFTFVGEQYPLQVGNKDFRIDLLFYHRELQCLVAFELKIEEFQPEHLGKLEFYLEALDRDVKKAHERPSIGVLLCATRDTEVVKYALSRSASPTLIAEYQTALPNQKLLQRKLHEFYQLAMPPEEKQKTTRVRKPKRK